jgi:hypothetical protein
MRYEVLRAVQIIMFFWIITPSGLVGGYQQFGDTYYLHFQG